MFVGRLGARSDAELDRAEHGGGACADGVPVGFRREAHAHQHARRPHAFDAEPGGRSFEVLDEASHEHRLVLALQSDLVEPDEHVTRLLHP